MKSGIVPLLCILLAGCSAEPPPTKIIQTISFENAARDENWSEFLEGFEFVAAGQPVNRKDLAALNYFLIQTHYLAATTERDPLTISKSSNFFRTVDSTLKEDMQWTKYVEEIGLKERVNVLAMWNLIEEILRGDKQ